MNVFYSKIKIIKKAPQNEKLYILKSFKLLFISFEE